MVPSPETPLRVMRGSTTQNFASSTMRLVARLDIFAVTSTPSESFASSTLVTWPIFTSLYLTSVFPASIPSATLNMMVMVGPSVRMRSTAIPTAITAARMGMIHTIEMRELLFETTLACASSSRSPSAMISLPGRAGIPDETGVEGHRRQHGQDDHGGEEDHARTGLYGHQRLQLHERDGEGVDEHVQHRPAPDDLHQTIQSGPVPVAPRHAALDRDEEIGEGHQLAERDHHARHQHGEGQRPRPRGVEEHHAAHDGVGIGRAQGGGGEHGQHVGGDVADGRGDHERPRALDGLMTAPRQLGAAAWTMAQLRLARRLGQEPAGLARNEPGLSSGSDRHARASGLDVARATPVLDRWGSTHSIRRQISSASKVIPIAVRSTTRAPTAYIPMPGSTRASSAILISAMRMPRIITSTMDHGCMKAAQRSSPPTHLGAGGRRTASSTVSRKTM